MDGRYVIGGVIVLPLVMFFSKLTRMDARDRHEVHMDLRYRASFWEKANQLTESINESIRVSVGEELTREQSKFNKATS